MWSPALAALAAFAVAVDCACPRGFEPLNKTVRRLAMNGPMTWQEVDDACSEQFPGGFQMLGRDFLRLSDRDRALCQGHSVPLKLEKKGLESVVWSDKPLENWELEEVKNTYLERKLEADSTRTSALVGSLSPCTGEWRLVDNDTTFDCAVCQRAWVDGFWRLKDDRPANRPDPFDATYTFRLVATGGDSVGVDEAIHLVEERLNGTVDRDDELRHVKIVKVASDPGGGNGTMLRLQASRLLEPDDVIAALNGSFEVGSWQATHLCPSSSFLGIDWQETGAGDLDYSRLPGSQYATRRCLWRTDPDGGREPAWDDDVLFWTDRMHECQETSVSNLLRRLKEFVERADPGDLDLKPLVEVTNDANVQDLVEDKLVEVTGAIVQVLSSLVSTTTNASSACHGSACAFVAGYLQGAEKLDTLLISHKGATPTFLNVEESGAAYQTTHMSLHLPQALTSAGRVAVHAWRSIEIYGGDKKIDDTMVVQVVSSRPFDESEPERSRPGVTFQLNNTGVGSVGRYRSVWSLAESPEDLRSCPLVRSRGTVDTYLCNKWIHKSGNVTSLSFVAFKLNVDKNFTNSFVDRALPQVLRGFTVIPIDKYAILEVAEFTNEFVKAIVRNDSSELTTPSVAILNPWEEILSGVYLAEERVVTASLDHVKVLVSDLTVSDSAVGLSFDWLAGAGAVKTVTAGSRNVSAESEVDLVLGAGVQEHCRQLAVLAVSDVADFHINGSLEAYIKRKLMVVYLVVTSKNETEAGSGNVYFEIHLRGGSQGDDKSNLVGSINDNKSVTQRDDLNESRSAGVKVATWSEAARDWLVSSCTKLRSTRASKWVVRCESLTFAGQQFRGSYLIFEAVG